MDGSRWQPLKPLCTSRHFGFPTGNFQHHLSGHLLKNTEIVGYTRRFLQSASTWLAQRALCADVVLSSSTTCSKRISSEGPDPEVKAVCLSGHLFEVMKATYHHLVLLSALLRQRNTYTWCWPWRPSRVRTLKLGAPPLRGLDGHLSSTWYS